MEDNGTSWACKDPDSHLRNKRVRTKVLTDAEIEGERERGREGEKVRLDVNKSELR